MWEVIMLISEHESDTEKKNVLDWKQETINGCHPYRNSD